MALDATGLAVRKYTQRWLTTGYAARGRDFLKLHAAIEIESQAFVGWVTTLSNQHEAKVGPDLLDRVTGRVTRVYADAGYLSNPMCVAVAARGATPYIRPKKTSKGREATQRQKGKKRPHEAYLHMMDAYQADRDAWMREYHKRSRIESAFAGLKQRFGGRMAAMTRRTQEIELTLKLLAWNLTRKARKLF